MLEISVLGRSIGESIVVRFGEERLMVVDSFMSKGQPVALRYMRMMGYRPENVEFVVGTHWDNDHMRGLGEILTRCENAEFVSHAVSDPEFLQRLIAEAEESSSASWSAGAEAFGAAADVVSDRGDKVRLVGARYFLCRESAVSVLAMSPTIAAVNAGRAAIARQLVSNPRPGGSAAVAVAPNLTSVVLWIETDTHAALLGADLENDKDYGWSAAINETHRHRLHAPASLIKIPHHGSPDADEPEMWSELLSVAPRAVLTPFSTKRPQPSDIERIEARASDLKIAAGPGWGGRLAAIMQSALPQVEVDERQEVGFVRYEAIADGAWGAQAGYV